MSLYLPTLNSYTFVEPELFVDESKGAQHGRRKRRKSKPRHYVETRHQKPALGAITENVTPALDNNLMDGHVIQSNVRHNVTRRETINTSNIGVKSRPHDLEKQVDPQITSTLDPENKLVTEGTSVVSQGVKLPFLSKPKWQRLKKVVQEERHRNTGDSGSGGRRSRHNRRFLDVVANIAGRHGIQGTFLKAYATVRYTPEEMKEKFIKAVKMMMILRNIASMVSQKAGQGERPQTFTDMASDSDDGNLKSSGLSFDPSYFKARKEISISSEVKNILSLPSEERSPDQVQTAMFGLQSLRSFAEYPLHMQEKLAKVAWYEVIPPKRIIIRQGHYAENFYFILSGQAVVTILVRDPKTGGSVVRTATIMRKGMSFGELALLHHSRRTATVTSQDTVQLLTIGREDFFEIFMAGSGPDDIPDHIKFVSQCDFMKDWPIEKLLERPEQCLLHFFKRNVVIVKDSRQSEWMYVVKSGSCQVLKCLKGVTARLGIPKKELQTGEFKLPVLATGEQCAKVYTGRGRKRALPPVMPPPGQEKDGEDAENAENPETEQQGFSRLNYMQNLTTKKAHFSAMEKRKQYEIPKRNRPPAPPSPGPVKDGKLAPVFVQVEHLKPRDAFGLETIQFDDDIERPSTSVSLVSRGAECIMLSKEFFIKHANELVKQCVRQQLRPYPAEETFQENLQIKVDWELYKQVMIEDLTTLP